MKNIITLIVISASLFSNLYAADPTPPENPVLVRVNGVDISMQQVQHFMQQQQQQVSPQQAVAEMINVELLNQAAKNEEMMKDPELELNIQHTTSRLIASHYLQKFLQKIEFDEEELQQRYDQEYKSEQTGMEYNANHILVDAEQQAMDLIKQLDSGAKFAELAEAHSTGPSGKDGGALGWFKKTDMVAPFAEAAIALEPGAYSKTPVKTQFGWHIIQLNESRTQQPPSFEEVRKQLTTAITAERISNKIKGLHEKSTIEFDPEK